MRNAHSAIVFLMILIIGLSLAVLPEDVAETAFDESEGLPSEGTPLFSGAVALGADRAAQALSDLFHQELGAPSSLPSVCLRHIGTSRLADTQISLALLCTLLC